uniref:Uncharacterized protein n=1 Tax=Anguilla anguilla TaxID=7936 RepID=A0A0E9SE85_ANGAN
MIIHSRSVGYFCQSLRRTRDTYG